MPLEKPHYWQSCLHMILIPVAYYCYQYWITLFYPRFFPKVLFVGLVVVGLVYECSQILKNDVRRRRRRWLNGQENNLFGGIQACPVLSKRQIGTVVYGFSSYFNHSCDPNVTFIIGGKANVMLATRAVRAGQELCISYGPTFPLPREGGA